MRTAYLAAMLLLAALVLAPLLAVSNRSGAPLGRSGGPPAGATCTTSGCHTSFNLNDGPGSITVDASAEYLPGTPLVFTVRVEQEAVTRFGFQVSVQDAGGQHVGTLELVDVSVTKRADALGRYVTHTVAGADQNSWEVRWTPPQEGAAGPVTIYAAGVATNSNNTSTGDYVYTTQHTLQPSVLAGRETVVDVPRDVALTAAYPNPFGDAVMVTYDVLAPGPVTLEVVDALGRTVRTVAPGAQVPGAYTQPLELATLPAGAYYVQVRSATTRQVLPIMKTE